MIAILCSWALIFASLYLVCVFIAATWGVCSGMARIKLGPNITDIRGSFKEVVYSVWKSGVAYIRSKAQVIVNPQSIDQAEIREMLQERAKAWASWSQDQRDSWEAMAQRLAGIPLPPGGIRNLTPPVGGIMSGFNAALAFGVASAIGPGGFSAYAPLGEDQPDPPTNVAVAEIAPGQIEITWTDPVTKDPDAMIRVWLRSHEKTYHKQLIGHVDLALETITLNDAKGALGQVITFTNAAPVRLIIQLDVVNPSGFRSSGSNTVEITIP